MSIKTEDYIREVLTILFAQKKIVLGTCCLFLAVTLVVAFFFPPLFNVEGQIMIRGKKAQKAPETLEKTELKVLDITQEDLNTEMRIIHSKEVAQNTVRSLKNSGQMYQNLPLEGQQFNKAVKKIIRNLEVELVPKSNVLSISMLGNNPDRMLSIMETLFNEYVRYRSKLDRVEGQEAFYKREIDTFRQKIQTLESDLIGIAKRAGTPEPVREIESNNLLRKELQKVSGELEREAIDLQETIRMLDRALDSKRLSFYSFIENPSINALSGRLQDLYMERGQIARIYSDQSKKLRHVDEQLEDTFVSLKSEVDSYKENLNARLTIVRGKQEAIKKRLDILSKRNIDLYMLSIESQRVERDLDLLKQSYKTFATRLGEANISSRSSAQGLFSISVLSRPSYSGRPVFPNKGTFIPIGLLAGLVTGISLAFLKEYFEHTFKKPEDTERFAGLKTIVSVPDWKE